MDNINKTDWDKCFESFQQSREMEIYRNIEALQLSFRIFSDNFQELKQGLKHLQDPIFCLTKYNHDQKKNINDLLDVSIRLFHNFLASAFTLIEHTRVIINRLYANHSFKDNYQDKLKENIISSPIHGFVKGLRIYTQHYVLPNLSLETSFAKGGLCHKVKMDIEDFKKWEKYKLLKPYIETHKINVNVENLELFSERYKSLYIESIADEYYFLIQEFYDWLIEQQKSIHQADLIKLRQMEKELQI
jgi:hypothetical protein